MDIRDRVMGDQPNDFLHKIASMVPGYNGYIDKDKRRDADKLLRTELAKKYSAQRDRLNRVQQSLARNRQYTHISEVDRIVGVFQRFIDRLNVATYGYTGLFDPVKVEASDLDQIYAFDMALASGVDQVSSAIDAVESAAGGTDTQELPAALSRLSTLVDELNTRLNQRSDYLTSGRSLPQNEYKAMVQGASGQGAQGTQQGAGPASTPAPAQGASAAAGYAPPTQAGYQSGSSYSQPPQQGYQPNSGNNQPQQGYQPESSSEETTYQPSGYAPYSGQPQQSGGGQRSSYNPHTGGAGSMSNESDLGSSAYSQPGGGADVSGGDATGGIPTTNLNMQTSIPNEPGMGEMLDEGQTGRGDMMQPTSMGTHGVSDPTTGGAPDVSVGGVQTSSSPSHSTDPNSPGQTLTDGLSMSASTGAPDTGGGAGSALADLPGTSTATGTPSGGTGTGSSTDIPGTNTGQS